MCHPISRYSLWALILQVWFLQQALVKSCLTWCLNLLLEALNCKGKNCRIKNHVTEQAKEALYKGVFSRVLMGRSTKTCEQLRRASIAKRKCFYLVLQSENLEAREQLHNQRVLQCPHWNHLSVCFCWLYVAMDTGNHHYRRVAAFKPTLLPSLRKYTGFMEIEIS